MTIRFTDPFEHLVDGIRAYFTKYGVTSVVDVGFRARARQDNQGPGRANRVVLLPGDTGGRAGRIFEVREGGERPIYDPADPTKIVAYVRTIGDWERSFVVSVWACDTTTDAQARSELAQIVAVTHLLEWTKRAIDSVGFARLVYGDTTFTIPKTTSLGQEVLLSVTYRHPLFDIPREVTPNVTPMITKSGP